MTQLRLSGIRACVFDAYGTLFDVNSAAAKAFGFHVVWCNRFGQVPERIPERPDGEISTLSALPEILGI